LFPRGIAANARGNVFVADSGNNRIVKLFNPKASLVWIKSFTGASKNDKGLIGPSRIAIDEKVNVYVNDPGNRRIVVFDSSGTPVRTIPQAGQGFQFVDGPTALAIADGSARWSYGHDEQALFCADKNGSRVWKLGFDGRVIAKADMPAGHAACYGATDYYHNYYVTDRKNHCIVKFDHNLKLLDIFGSQGDKDNQFNDPRGIAVYKRFGQAFIAEKKGAQYFWIGTDLRKSTLVRKGEGKYFLTVQVTEYSLITLFSAVQKDTVTYVKRRWVPCGLSSFEFEVGQAGGIRDRGLTLKTEPTYSSFTYSAWYRPIRVTK
jgi:DNA-binding beta-propeller fold protein YncE